MTPPTQVTIGTRRVLISAIVPVYAGANYIERLVKEFDDVRNLWKSEAAPIELGEVILVDDCSKDGSDAIADSLAAKYPWVTSLHLARNSGQHAATVAGILHSSGDWILTLDEDLQHPPRQVTALLKKAVQTRGDVVYARAASAVHQAYARDFGSRIAKKVVVWLSGNKHVTAFNSFRLIRGSVARAAASVCSHDTYFDVVLSWFTGRIHSLDMELKDERFIRTGQSGYRIRSLFSHARRLVLTGQLKLLRLGGVLGLAMLTMSTITSIAMIIWKLLYPGSIAVAGWTSLMLAITFFGGLLALMLGVLMEYMSVLVLRSNGRPLYFTIDRSSDSDIADYLDLPTA